MSTDDSPSKRNLLQVEPASLPDDPSLLKPLTLQLLRELQSRDGRISDLEHRMDLLLRKLYGRKSEKLDPRQALLFDLLTETVENELSTAAPAPEPNVQPEPKTYSLARAIMVAADCPTRSSAGK